MVVYFVSFHIKESISSQNYITNRFNLKVSYLRVSITTWIGITK